MKFFAYILFAFNFLSVKAANVEVSFKEGLQAIDATDFKKADSIFTQLSIEDSKNASIWYNFGVVKYYLKDYSRSLWAFEKTIKLNPKDKDALLNASLCQRKLQLREYQPLMSPYQSFILSFSSNFWAIMGLLFFSVFSFALFIFIKRKKVRTTGFVLATILIFGSLYCIINAYQVNKQLRTATHGIIIKPSVSTYLNLAGNDAQIKLLQGTRFEIVERGESYYKIELIEGQVFYLKKEDVELI